MIPTLGFAPHMRIQFLALGVVLLTLALPAHAQIADSLDFMELIEKDSSVSSNLGLHKLTANEKVYLNRLFQKIFRLGCEFGAKRDSGTASSNLSSTNHELSPYSGSSSIAYVSKIDSDNGDVLHLDNGAIIEVTVGYLGYVGYRKEVVLFRQAQTWKIWIEGKRTYRCNMLKDPDYGTKYTFEQLTLSEVKGDGSLLITLDGSIFEVNSLYTINTSLWLPVSELILIDEYRLINLDEASEMIEVTRIN